MERADLLSLDVEGAEAIVLRTVDASRFRVVLVEMDGLAPAKDEEVHRLLSAGGLVHLTRLRIPNSRVYVRRDCYSQKLRDCIVSMSTNQGCCRPEGLSKSSRMYILHYLRC